MLSRRQFFTITLIMLVLLFLFQATSVMKDQWNEYGINEYAEVLTSGMTGDNEYRADVSLQEAQEYDFVLFVGDEEESAAGARAREWCSYTKRSFLNTLSLEDYAAQTSLCPEVILIDSDWLSLPGDVALLEEYAAQGVTVIFMTLPEAEIVAQNQELMDFLGIDEVRQTSVHVAGIELYDGFLLGGAALYVAEDEEEEEEKQDMDLDVPWYITRSATKVYMVGRISEEDDPEEEIDYEYYPSVIWRRSTGAGYVFAVSGDYMEDVTAIGILNAMMYETEDYLLYPVVNAQNLVFTNFAAFSSETDERMNGLYYRSQKAVFRDLVWPGILAVWLQTEDVPTLFLNPKLDYESGEEPDAERLIYFLKLIRENDGEVGLTTWQLSDLDLNEKLSEDLAFYEGNVPDYEFRALYVDGENEEKISGILEGESLEGVSTLLLEVNAEESVLGYKSNNVTWQRATADGFSHTYSDNLRVRSLETALGYSTILVDLDQVVEAESEEDSWEKLSEDFSSNVGTYWKSYSAFEKTSVSESDARIRQFLNLSYEEIREGDAIRVSVESLYEEAYFILRTHNEEIESMEGGTYEMIEEGAYLLTLTQEEAVIMLKTETNSFFYNN